MDHAIVTHLDAALHYASLGIHVFPVRYNEKAPPLISQWEQQASIDPDVVTKWWTENPDANIAIATGPSGLCVIDIDSPDVNGIWRQMMDYDDVLHVTTPSGNRHIYFRTDKNLKSSVRINGDPVDSRATGGYVLAPPSRLTEGDYVFNGLSLAEIGNVPLRYLPEDLERQLERKSQVDAAVEGMDRALKEAKEQDHLGLDSMARAIEYLSTTAYPAIEERGGDEQTYKVAAQVRDFGVEESTAYNLMLEYYNHRCLPPWEPSDLFKKVQNAYNYAQNEAIGQQAAEADFTPVPTEEQGITIIIPIRGDSLDLNAIPKREWTLGNRYMKKFISVLIAPGGVGKSMLTMAEAVSISTGLPLAGPRVHCPGPVLLYNTEDPMDEQLRRLAAHALFHGLKPSDLSDIHMVSGVDHPLIMAKESTGGVVLTSHAARLEEMIMDLGVVHVVIDPFVRSHRVQENDNMAIDKVLLGFSKMAQGADCSVSLVHHSRKGQVGQRLDADSARGASSLVSASRMASTMTTMTEQEAERFGLPENEKGYFVRLDNAKGNMAPPAEHALWYKKESVTLPNGDKVGLVNPIPNEFFQNQMEDGVIQGLLLTAERLEQFLLERGAQRLTECNNYLRRTFTTDLIDWTDSQLDRHLRELARREIELPFSVMRSTTRPYRGRDTLHLECFEKEE